MILQVQVNDSPPAARRGWHLLLLVALAVLASCERTPSDSGRVEVASVSVSPLTSVLEEDSTHQFQALVHDARGNPLHDRDLVWSSSDEAVARVSASGMVSANAPGEARIVATVEGKEGSAEVSVRPRPVASVRVSPPAAQLQARGAVQLQAELFDARGRPLSGRELRWESGDAAVATVEPDGSVTARAPGVVSILALSEGQRDSATITVTPGDPALLVKLGGDGQQGVVGSTLGDPLALRVTDADGHPIAGIGITWLAAGGGSVSPAIGETDASGTARAEWTLGTGAGAQSASASGAGLSTTFSATAAPGPAAALARHAGDGQSAPVGTALADSLVVRVTDAFGNPVSGTQVSWTASGGSASPATSPTGADGLARTRWTLGATPGEQSAAATVPGMATVGFRAFARRAPTVATLAATSVTPAGALLRGSANPHGLSATAWFEWSTSSTLAGHQSTPEAPVGSSLDPVTASHALGGLAPSTTYYFRVAAASEAGTSRGEIRSFTTEPAPPPPPPPPPPPVVRIVTFGDSNTDSGYQGRNSTIRARSYVSVMPERLGPDDPNSPFQLAGKIEARWAGARGTPLVAVNHGISNTTTGGGAGGGTNRSPVGAPHARTVVGGVTRFEAEALGAGHPWHGGEPVNASFPDGPVTRVKAYVPGEHDFLYISLGTNDAGQQVSTLQTLANLEWMIERWLAAGRRADHLMLTTLPPRTAGSGATIPQINDGIRALALARGVHLIDLAVHTSADNGVSWRSSQLHVGDGIHYAETVRDWLAERIVEHLRQRIPD